MSAYGTRVRMSNVDAPAGSMTAPGWMAVGHVDAADGRRLDLHNLVFVERGQIMWVEGDLFCVMRFDRSVDSYNGEWCALVARPKES